MTTTSEKDAVPVAAPKASIGERLALLLNPVMAAIIGGVVLALFAYAIWKSFLAVDDAPIAADATTGRDAYSAFDRSVQLVGLVSPVLTIVLGFYFGARVGAAGAEAAKTRADEVQAESTAKDKAIAHIQAMADSDQHVPVSTAIESARDMFPEAF
jgi:hypothetical protein